MSYADTISLVAGDTAPPITYTLRDSNTAAPGQTLDPDNPATWAPINLTGATVRFYVRAIGSAVLKDTVVGTLITPASGVVALIWNPTTLDTPGQYEVETEITFADNSVQTVYQLTRLKVRADF